MRTLELRAEVEDLYYDYAAALDDFELERWPEFFVEECWYKIISRENYDRGLPLATMWCESKGMLKDRVVTIRQTQMFAPRTMRHIVGNVRIKSDEGAEIQSGANYVVIQTLVDDESRIFNTGRYLDTLVREQGRLKFKSRICIYDTIMIPNSLIYPI